jgi:hypothetical protein
MTYKRRRRLSLSKLEEEHKKKEDEEYHTYMSWMFEQVKSVRPNITLNEFDELISLDGWKLENYIISRKNEQS